MIRILQFDRVPALVGSRRRLVLAGDGPFVVTTSLFVDSPAPSGAQPDPGIWTQTVDVLQPFDIEFTPLVWGSAGGHIRIHVRDSSGETAEIKLEVLPGMQSPGGGRTR